MKYKAIIFDMDGTIIDTDIVWKSAINYLLTHHSVILSAYERIQLDLCLFGLSGLDICRKIKQVGNLEVCPEELLHQLIQEANHIYKDNVKFIDGFVPFWKQAQQLGLRMGVATNSDERTVHIARHTLELDQFFGEHIYNPAHTNNKGKPDPALYLHAAQQLAIDPQLCIAIEDSAHGIKAAVNAGMFCIGIGTAKNPSLLIDSHLIVDGYHEIDLHNLLELPVITGASN